MGFTYYIYKWLPITIEDFPYVPREPGKNCSVQTWFDSKVIEHQF